MAQLGGSPGCRSNGCLCEQRQDSCVCCLLAGISALHSSLFWPWIRLSVRLRQAQIYLLTWGKLGADPKSWKFCSKLWRSCQDDLTCSWTVGRRVLAAQQSGRQCAHGSHETSNNGSTSLLTTTSGLPLPSAPGISNPTKLATSLPKIIKFSHLVPWALIEGKLHAITRLLPAI